MNAYREVRLGPEAVAYVDQALRDGGTLAHYLRETHDLLDGAVVTYLPQGIAVEAVRDLTSGFLPDPSPETHHVVVDATGARWRMVQKQTNDGVLAVIIQNFLRQAINNLCIFEDALRQPGGAWRSKIAGRILVMDQEIYHVLANENRSLENVLRTIKNARSWLMVGVLTSLPESARILETATELTREHLFECARNTRHIVVGAYDAEGFVLWTPNTDAPAGP